MKTVSHPARAAAVPARQTARARFASALRVPSCYPEKGKGIHLH